MTTNDRRSTPSAPTASTATGTGAVLRADGRRRLVYVAGPYTHPDPVLNVRAAVAAAERIYARGDLPLVPHLSMLWHLVSPHDVAWWYGYDEELLERCDLVVRLPGASTGADNEVKLAHELGIPVEEWAA